LSIAATVTPSLAATRAIVRSVASTSPLSSRQADFVLIAKAYPNMRRALAIEVSERLRQRGHLIRKRNPIPVVFVGSSSEALPVAKLLHAALPSPAVEARIWELDVFNASNFPIEDLEAQAQQSDFAVLVATADDIVKSRRKVKAAPRDNVIFELGLFMGASGRKRTFVVQPKGVDLKLPSDILGMTTIRYDASRADYIQAVADELLKIFARQGPR
jgi:CRP/FNR family cyclic AMP-dependent transcriptional regulator